MSARAKRFAKPDGGDDGALHPHHHGNGATYDRSGSYVRGVPGLLLSVHALMLAWGAYVHSPTLNEPGHLVAGISHWRFGRFDVYNVNPPLVHLVASVPVLAAGVETDWRSFYEGPGARAEFALGESFVAANGERAMWLMRLARWACIPFSLLGGYICFRWAKELYGEAAGIVALALWCFCPNILAHGQLITPDVAATSLALAACYAFWRWLKQPTWWSTLSSGLILGLAELAKTTLVVFYPLWIVMWLVYRWAEWREGSRLAPRDESGPGDERSTGGAGGPALGQFSQSSRGARGLHAWWLRELAMLLVQMVLSIYVLNLGYGFEGTCERLRDFRFVSAALGAEAGADKAPRQGGNRFAKAWLAGLPVPLPKNYVLGIDLQKRDFEGYNAPSYLRGEFRQKGWWYYYLYALAIKVPLGTWLLIGLAATAGVLRSRLAPREESGTSAEASSHQTGDQALAQFSPSSRGARGLQGGIRWRDEFVLLAPAVVILAFVSSQTGFSEHMRYVLPCFPFVFVWIGRVAFVFSREWWGSTAQPQGTEGPHPALAQRARVLRRAVTGVAAAALVWSVASSLWVYPHSLSYFNELVGGPTGGPEHLIHSNVDWGQDLLFLKDWLDEHPEAAGSGDPRRAPINLIYFGYFDPRHAGIEYSVAEELFERQDGPVPLEKIPPGWYAVSVNFVRGYPWFVYKPDGSKAGLPQGALTAFQQLQPVAMAGYSIYIYHVE